MVQSTPNQKKSCGVYHRCAFGSRYAYCDYPQPQQSQPAEKADGKRKNITDTGDHHGNQRKRRKIARKHG